MALLLVPAVVWAQMGHSMTTDGGPTRDNLAITYGWLKHVAGFTICTQNQGFSFVAADLSEIERLDTQAHELKHREQMARYPTCDGFDKLGETLNGRVMIEAEAYAAGLCVSVKHGGDKLSLERDYAERISVWVAGRRIPPVVLMGVIRGFEKC